MILRLLRTLTESQSRWYVAKEALAMGHGGLKAMHELTGMSRPTILRGVREFKQGRKLGTGGRQRRIGGGRKRIEERVPKVMKALRGIMEETTAGDPMSLLRWSCKSTSSIAEELTKRVHAISQSTVHRRLCEMGYSLRSNVKTHEGTEPGNRDEQFRTIHAQVKAFTARGEPVLSIDAKKKERIGAFQNKGKTWRPKGKPYEVNVYDYPSLAMGTAIPYGAYDVSRNEGFVNVGMSHETAEFAVESIRRWWHLLGRRHYPKARRWLLCADGGGSNGSRRRSWKYYLQRLSDQLGVEITLCHYPRGTSKWNKIEHRLFSFISIHWKGEPLVSYETVVNLIGTTKTKEGLRVKAKLDRKKYETGVEISDEEMNKLNIKYHTVNPQWNYTIYPRVEKKGRRK